METVWIFCEEKKISRLKTNIKGHTCGQLVYVPPELLVLTLQSGVLVENDLFSLDAHIATPFGSLVVFQTPSPIPGINAHVWLHLAR